MTILNHWRGPAAYQTDSDTHPGIGDPTKNMLLGQDGGYGLDPAWYVRVGEGWDGQYAIRYTVDPSFFSGGEDVIPYGDALFDTGLASTSQRLHIACCRKYASNYVFMPVGGGSLQKSMYAVSNVGNPTSDPMAGVVALGLLPGESGTDKGAPGIDPDNHYVSFYSDWRYGEYTGFEWVSESNGTMLEILRDTWYHWELGADFTIGGGIGVFSLWITPLGGATVLVVQRTWAHRFWNPATDVFDRYFLSNYYGGGGVPPYIMYIHECDHAIGDSYIGPPAGFSSGSSRTTKRIAVFG